MIKILIKLGLLLLIIYSCSNKQYQCEGFNFDRLPYDSTYFCQDLYYTNGEDTIKIFKVKSEFDAPSTYGQFGYSAVDCHPSFYISTENDLKTFRINYFFDYYPHEDNKLKLLILINSCEMHLSFDTLQKKEKFDIQMDTSPNICVGTDSSQWIKNIQLENLKIITIEKFSGEKWFLIR